MKTFTVTKKHCVIDEFMTESDVQFIEVVDKAKKMAKSIEMKPINRDGINYKNKVISIVENKPKSEVVISYEEVEENIF
jgi:hypothetical protein